MFQIQDEKGDVTITNDGATILKQMQVLHPAAKMVRSYRCCLVVLLFCIQNMNVSLMSSMDDLQFTSLVFN